MSAAPQRILSGIGLKVVSTFLFGAMGACIKGLGPAFPTGEIVFFRSALALVPVVIAVMAAPAGFSALVTRRPLSHAGRSLTGAGAMFSNFAAIQLLAYADATAIWFASPLFLVALAALLLGEVVRIWRWSAVIVGFLGVAIAVSPHADPAAWGTDEAMGAGFALTGALLAAFAMIFIRTMAGTENPNAIVFWFSVSCTILSLATIPFGWVWPEGWEWALLVGAGLLGGLAQMALTNAFRLAPASVVAPFEYAAMLWALAFGYTLFDETPHPVTLMGAGVIIASGLFILWRERQIHRGRTAEAQEGKPL